MTRTGTTTKSNIILLYKAHTSDHMILVHTAECTAVVLAPGTYIRASAAGSLQKSSVVDVKKEY